ncbi:MAG: gliding motility-associated C-terminal domain-containing protein, partial [Saprospiraceae bacterium]|nr:gliding motility-associated C-terminal domain-containing protein [Saprospiraceae bacterium]
MSFATHNRAGEITYVQIDELTIRATITTYTKTSSFSADRDSVEMFWGDGTSQFVKRDNGKGSPIENDVKINYYTAEHTYPSRGTYTMGMLDPNRVAGILNVDFPNS